jgi:molybdate transport system permease protein
MSYDPAPLLLSFELAVMSTAILLIIGVPLAWWLAFSHSRFQPVAEALISMPLVLPPTVLGFYLLLLFGRGGWLWELLDPWGIQLVFTFEGLVVASVIASVPFMVHPLQSGFRAVPPSLVEASYTLGKSRLTTLVRVLLPNMKSALLAGVILTFAHVVGEFGVVLMIGGSIPGVTKVASIAIYDEVQALNYSTANIHALILFAVTFAVLLVIYGVNRRFFRPL